MRKEENGRRAGCSLCHSRGKAGDRDRYIHNSIQGAPSDRPSRTAIPTSYRPFLRDRFRNPRPSKQEDRPDSSSLHVVITSLMSDPAAQPGAPADGATKLPPSADKSVAREAQRRAPKATSLAATPDRILLRLNKYASPQVSAVPRDQGSKFVVLTNVETPRKPWWPQFISVHVQLCSLFPHLRRVQDPPAPSTPSCLSRRSIALRHPGRRGPRGSLPHRRAQRSPLPNSNDLASVRTPPALCVDAPIAPRPEARPGPCPLHHRLHTMLAVHCVPVPRERGHAHRPRCTPEILHVALDRQQRGQNHQDFALVLSNLARRRGLRRRAPDA
nr:hypothetical protein CFP56_72532 [Quercus suber]